MRTKRVVLLSNHSLLTSGVQKLLQGVEGLELSVIAAPAQEIVPVLKRLAPDAIVLDTGDTSLGEGVITQLLAEHPKARVVALNANRVGLEVYRLKRVLQADLDGLLKAILGRAAAAGQGPGPQRPQRVGARRSENGGGAMGP